MKDDLPSFKWLFKYSIGTRVKLGDLAGIVTNVILPETTDSDDFQCRLTGGLLVETDRAGLVLVQSESDLSIVD